VIQHVTELLPFGLSTSVWGRVAVEEAPQACSACSTRACYDTLAASAVAVASSKWYVPLGMTCAWASGEIGPSAEGALLTARVGPPIRTPHSWTPFTSAVVVHPIKRPRALAGGEKLALRDQHACDARRCPHRDRDRVGCHPGFADASQGHRSEATVPASVTARGGRVG
jgi:hypothetical protein